MHNPISDDSFEYDWGGENNQSPYYEGQVYGSTPGSALTEEIPLSQDVAFVQKGTPWRLPTSFEFAELIDNCDYVEADGITVIPQETEEKTVTVNNIVGIYLKSKINGNLLFFACTGEGQGTNYYSRGRVGLYWSKTIVSERNARVLRFGVGINTNFAATRRFYGCPVRPVFNNNRGRALNALSKYARMDMIDILEPVMSENKKQ